MTESTGSTAPQNEKGGFAASTAAKMLALAVMLGIIGVVLLTFYLRGKEKRVLTVTVAVATRPMAEGDTIRPGAVVAREMPRGVIGGRFVAGSEIVAVEGRVLGAALDAGQPLYWNAIPLTAQGGYDRYLRPENRERAFAITIAGAPARPGDVIDILGTYTQGSQRQAFEVLPAVTVIDKIGSTLVLSVTPEEQLLLLAAQPCNLTLSIRSKMEPEEEDLRVQPVTLADVLPRSRELGRARTARLQAEGSIRRE